MVDIGRVEIDCLLHESQAERPDIEIQIALRIARKRRDVVKTPDIA